MNKFLQWMNENSIQISWFIIGWMTLQGFNSLGKGDYFDFAICWGLAFINFITVRRP